jgi:hypothetical protein
MSDGFGYEDYDASPHDAAFGAMRTGIAFVSEYGPIALPDTKLAWAVEDLRDEIKDLVDALMDNDSSRIVESTRNVIKLVKDVLGDI